MGSKGSATSTTNQSQTYAPSPQAAGYLTGALNQGQSAAQTPFQAQVAPVAGFSQDQQRAFNSVNNAQGMAQPYINQAANYFSPQGAQSFLNPYASNVMAGMKDVFGQQASQNTGQLTQAAGGVGADRIAVGQANLAHQQDLAAGQTLSGLYQNSAQQAQAAGYGTAALGSQAQNAALQGAQAQLGTGGLQQQLSQAQMNAPYQWDLARLAYPFQTAQFNAGITGALAPALGGTTQGTGTTTSTPAQPSIWSQLLGAGTAAAGVYGSFGGGGGSGKGAQTGASYGGYDSSGGSTGGWGSMGGVSYPAIGAVTSGVTTPYARGGDVHPYAPGGAVSDEPINIDSQSVVPQMQLAPAQMHQPQLNLNPPQQSGGGGGGGPGLADIAKIAMMFVNRGGRIDPKKFDGYNPYFASGGTPQQFIDNTLGDPGWSDPDIGVGYAQPSPKTAFEDRGGFNILPRENRPVSAYQSASADDQPSVPLPRPRPAGADVADAAPDATTPLAFSGDPAPSGLPPEISGGNSYAPQGDAPSTSPFSSAPSGEAPNSKSSFADSPWAALVAAGLGMMGGSSPFAGVNIGQGGMQGLKTLQQQKENSQKDTTIAQAAKRLEQEAKFHEDQYSRLTMGQKQAGEQANRPYEELTAAQKAAETRADRPYSEMTAAEKAAADEQRQRGSLEAGRPFKIGTDRSGFDIMGVRDPNNPGGFIDAITGKPVDPARVRGAAAGQPSAAAEPDGAIPANSATVAAGAYNYSEGAPAVEKGMDVPEPAAVGGHSARSLQTDAEYYLQTGKLPPGPRGGKSPTAIAQNDYVNAVRNYAGSLATARGLTPEQTAEMWRTAPGMLRFILGQDGRSTVALGTAVRHLDTLRQYADAWKANDIQAINRLRAAISREFGSDAATNLESAGKIVGPEIIKALGVAGAGTSDERQGASGQFSAIKSPEQMAGAIGVTQRLLGGQLEGRKRQAMSAGLSEERFKNLVGERPFEVLSTIDKPGATSSAAALPDAAKAHLTEGQVTTFGNGQKWTLKNGQPAQVP